LHDTRGWLPFCKTDFRVRRLSSRRARRANDHAEKVNASVLVGAPARARSGPFEKVTRLTQAVTETLELSIATPALLTDPRVMGHTVKANG
jgi:hypothetical protein